MAVMRTWSHESMVDSCLFQPVYIFSKKPVLAMGNASLRSLEVGLGWLTERGSNELQEDSNGASGYGHVIRWETGRSFPELWGKDKSWCICWNGVPVGGLKLLESFSYHRRKSWKWLRQPQMRKQDYSHIVQAERTDGEKAGPFQQCGSKLAWGLGTSQEC